MTVRQQSVVDLLMLGYKQPAIAEQLGLAQRTVKCHLQQIARNMGITRGWHLQVRIVYMESIRRGLIQPYEPLPSTKLSPKCRNCRFRPMNPQ